MEPAAGREGRFETLLHAACEMGDAEESRSFLESVCEGNPALLAGLLETITLARPPGPAPPAPLFGDGQIVGERFQILRPLGEGGMATVYEALDQKLGERRALKFPKAGYSRTMPPEARSAMRVTHDNICRIHEIHTADTDSGRADFISMEFLEGETLLSRWQREPVPQAEAVDIARQLCRGLGAAHRAHILHRDLKSNNVMLTRHADGSPRVVITDFGLARPLAPAGSAVSSAISGTPNYIAPEIWKGAEPSAAADIYALGVVLYEMLAGCLPFPRGTSWNTRLTGLPAAPGKSERAPDARWDAIVLRCLAPDPAKRYGSAGEVLEAIEKAFRISHKKQWLAGAVVAVLTIGPAVIWRERIWPPPPLARLAVLPFTGTAADRGVDEAVRGGLYDVAERLSSLGASSRRVVVIPLEDSLRHEVNSAAKAAARLGATHVLSGAIGARGRVLELRAAVTDTRSGETVREFSGEFQPGDLAGLSTSLAGVVTSAFHLDKAPPASVSAAAYPSYTAGLASLRSGSSSYEQALDSLQSALKLDSSSPLIHAALAEAFLQKFMATKDAQWLREASALARRADSLHPDSPQALIVLGSVESAEGRPEQAIERFKRATELEPNDSQAWRRNGVALQRMGRDADAVKSLRQAVLLAPDYYASHRDLGVIHFQMGRHSEAVAEFRTVTRLAPELPEGYSYLGAALLAMEQEPEAEAALRRSLELRKTRTALNNLSVLLRYQGRDEEAARTLEEALGTGADDPVIRLNLANALRRTGHVREARGHFQKASDLARAALLRDPRDAPARVRLAYAMVQLGASGLAADEALQAARLAPADYSVLFWSVMTLESLGRRDDALALLANAPYQRLRDLRRQPDLRGLSGDPRFLKLIQDSQGENLEQKEKR